MAIRGIRGGFSGLIPKRILRLAKLTRNQWAGVTVILCAGLLYLTTLQTDINGADTPYTPDVGEIINALNLWGTLHQAGYPIFSILGSAFVTLVKFLGPNPATAAGLWSWAWALVAVGLAYLITLHLTQRWWVAAVTALALTVTRSLWVNGSIAELQSFSLSLAALTLWLALNAAEAGATRPKWFHVLAFVFGLAVSHGRALVLLAPALAVLLWQPYLTYLRRRPLMSLGHAALACLPWLSYLYLPLRVQMGAIWTFGKPTTWETLRPFITADETRTNISVAGSLADWLDRTLFHLEVLNTEFLPGLLALGLLAALIIPLFNRRWTQAAFLTLAWLPFFGAAYFAYIGHIWDAYLSVLMPVTLIGVIGLGLAINWLCPPQAHPKPTFSISESNAQYSPQRAPRKFLKISALPALSAVKKARVAAGLLLIAALIAGYNNYGYVSEIKTASRGRELIEIFKQAHNFRGPGRTVLSAPWGLDYFALAYGALVNNELPGAVIVDQTAHYDELLAAGDRVYVLPRFFYLYGLDFWDNLLGRVYLTSAAPGLVQVAAAPPLTLADVPNPEPHFIGDSITLFGRQTRFDSAANTFHVTLYWQAGGTPSQAYSVFVHLSDQPAITTGEDILAQSDSATPVYGFYPTTRWTSGEIVREDYAILLPDSRRPILLRVGLYTRTVDGGFENLGEVNFSINTI